MFVFAVYVLFGALSAVFAVAGLLLVFVALPVGIGSLLVAAVFGLLSLSVNRSYRQLLD